MNYRQCTVTLVKKFHLDKEVLKSTVEFAGSRGIGDEDKEQHKLQTLYGINIWPQLFIKT